MATKRKAAGRTRAASKIELHPDLTARLARTKPLLIGAYGLHALSLAEAERIAARLRGRYPTAWRAA